MTVQSEFDSLRGRFGAVFIEVFDILKMCSLENIKRYLRVAFQETRGEVEMIKSADELETLLMKKSCFSNYNMLEQLVYHLQLADAQKKLSEYKAFRDEKYGKILAEDFAIEAVNESMKDHETQVCCECALMYY